MGKDDINKNHTLEQRTQVFAKKVRAFPQPLQRRPLFFEDSKQLLRSSGSVAANYIEANESLTKKDFTYRISICRKEAKETMFWLSVFVGLALGEEQERKKLYQEATELMKIFNAILWKVKYTDK